MTDSDAQALLADLRVWALGLGFSQIGVAGIDLSSAEPGLLAWLDAGFHGAMSYMQNHGLKRARPAELVPGTVRVLTARMGLSAARHAAGLAGPGVAAPGRSAARPDLALRPRPRLPQGAARAAAAAGQPAGRGGRASGLPGVHRFGAGAGGGAGFALGPGLARPAHAGPAPRGRLDVLSRRDLHRPATAAERAGQRALRPVPGPASMSAPPRRSSRLTGWMRGAASPT